MAGVIPSPGAGAAPRYSWWREQTREGVELVVLRDAVGGLEAAVAPTEGGELSGLRVRFRGTWLELLHRAREYGRGAGWRGKAPILWPAVGLNFAHGIKPDKDAVHCSYDWAGRRYEIPIHGFARHKAWRVAGVQADRSGAQVEVVLTDDDETRTMYPFGFEFSLIYRLEEGRLALLHRVTSRGGVGAAMFFSIGNHITFRVPFSASTPLGACYFESPARLEYLKDKNYLATGLSRVRPSRRPVPLSELSVIPPVALGDYEGEAWVRLSDASGLAVRISHLAQVMPPPPVVSFNLWGAPADGYFCPEPWIGLPGSFNLRKGLVHLRAGETWRWRILIEPEFGPV